MPPLIDFTTPESFRDSFKNEKGETIRVFAYVDPTRDKKEFMVETSINIPNEDGTETIKKKTKWLPVEMWDSFVEDFKARKESTEHAGTFEKIQHGEIKTPEDLGSTAL